MVVARKTPGVPPQPASRSASSQAIQRATKAKSNQIVNNRTSTDPDPKIKKLNQPPKQPKERPPKSFLPRYLFNLLLVWFCSYVFLVCPSDSSPVCRSLDLYRSNIIDPYLLPLSHSIYQRVEPHLAPLNPYIDTIKPYTAKPIQFTKTHVVPRVKSTSEWAIEQYYQQLAPRLHWFFVDQYWNGVVKPIYFKGVHPTLERHTRPYRIYYHRYVLPATYKSFARSKELYRRSRPHIIRYTQLARQRSYQGYLWTKPHLINTYVLAKPHAIRGWEKVQDGVRRVVVWVGEAREEYVDPHVRRILEKVGEKEGSKLTTVSSVVEPIYATQASAVAEESTVPATPDVVSASSVIVDSAHPQSGALDDIVPEFTSIAPTTPTAATVSAAPSPEPELEAETSTPEETVSSDEPSVVVPLPPVPTSSVSETPVPSAVVEEDLSAASVVSASMHASPPGVVEEGNDVDDFLKGIGLDDTPASGSGDQPIINDGEKDDDEDYPDPSIPDSNQSPTHKQQQLSPEQQAEITAAKRADITKRHATLQKDLDEIVVKRMEDVKEVLRVLRAGALEELGKWGGAKDAGQGGVVGVVEREAERMVRGVEGYLKGVEGKFGGGKGGDMDKEKEKWEKVLEKVDEKFSKKVVDVHREVHEWFVAEREREVREVEVITEEVKVFAQDAQSQVGLDYAWLDDVTYRDWQNYHDLIRTSENFTAEAQKIQQDLESDVVIGELNKLEMEVEEVVDGFRVALDGVRRRASGVGGVFGDATDSSGTAAAAAEEEEEEPRVSVLPVEEGLPEWEKVGVKPPSPRVPVAPEQVILGRSKEEVEERLKGVPVEEEKEGRRRAGARSEEL